ncbi:MAG TPA: flagellar protein FliT [Noviherbaspirillum sp.]|nr:flagellar protein FliT [Noviherbaspirillum sp.]
MVTTAELLGRYTTMLSLSAQMLGAAKQGDWDRLVELEQQRSQIEASLTNDDKISWQGVYAAQKADLIHTILATDAQTRSLTQIWMNEMQGTLQSIGTERKVRKAYEAVP